jgi:MFS family permease
MLRRRLDGRLLVAAGGVLGAAPFALAALLQPSGALLPFIGLLGVACALMYLYYATVYATIHDVVEPALRGTAMAAYFFTMYVFGGAFGPLVTGGLSDALARRAAAGQPLEAFRAVGLHDALYLVPALSVLLALVLFAGARTLGRDVERLRAWMRVAGKGSA